jgi:hypothetical protein
MSFPVQHSVTLQDGGMAHSLGQVALARSTWAEKEAVFPLADEGAGSQIEDQAAIHLGVKPEIEIIQRLLGAVTKLSLFVATLQ